MDGSTVPETKVCAKCGLALSLNRFGPNKNHRDGRASYCRDCRRAYLRELARNPRPPRPTVAERLASNLLRNEVTGCLEWQGCLSVAGYGWIAVKGRCTGAHRVAWELAHGPIPAGLCICHRCDNPPCCNPDHLFLGDRADNNADKMSKGRHRAHRGELHGKSVLTESDVREIRRLYATGWGGYRPIAKRFGIGKSTVIHIIRRRTWAHVR